MSFKSREKKRRMKAADAKRRIVIERHRRRDDMRARHFLTPVQRNCCCNRCGDSLRAGRDDCVYRHTPREILCLNCANVEQIPLSPVEQVGGEGPQATTADTRARIETMTPTMISVPIAATVQIKRMTEFASDVTRLADERPDLDLRALT